MYRHPYNEYVMLDIALALSHSYSLVMLDIALALSHSYPRQLIWIKVEIQAIRQWHAGVKTRVRRFRKKMFSLQSETKRNEAKRDPFRTLT